MWELSQWLCGRHNCTLWVISWRGLSEILGHPGWSHWIPSSWYLSRESRKGSSLQFYELCVSISCFVAIQNCVMFVHSHALCFELCRAADECQVKAGEFTCGQIERMHKQWILYRDQTFTCPAGEMEIEFTLHWSLTLIMHPRILSLSSKTRGRLLKRLYSTALWIMMMESSSYRVWW